MRIEFIQFEADDLDQKQHKTDEEEIDLLTENDYVIDDESVHEESEEPSFYRFVNQTRELNEALNCRIDRRDLQPEMFIAESRENLDFDEFDESVKLSDKFQKTLHKFEDVDVKDSSFGAVLFGLLTKLSSNNENFMVEWAGEKLGEEFIEKLLSEKENLRFDDCFEKFHFVNELLEQ